MSQKMHIHWDAEADHLEVRFGEIKPSYYEDIGDDVFERRDEENNKVIGYAFFNVQKRKKQVPQDITVNVPTETSSPVS
jgi:hypothetical protein